MKAKIPNDTSNDNKYKFNYRMRRKLSKAIAHKMKNSVGFVSINDGDKVKLNYDRITSRNDYTKEEVINEKYKKFIENNKDKIFTAQSEQIATNEGDENKKRIMNLFSLKESKVKWLFHPVDLIKVDDSKENNNDK